MPRAVILTALPVEYMAVRTHLTDLQEEIHPQDTIYERGKFVANAMSWEVGIVEVGAGNAGVAGEAEREIAYFNPSVILFVGVAGGIKDVALGDVVAATKVYGYESGKVKRKFEPRPDVGLSTYSLIQRARAEAKKIDWLQRLTSTPDSNPCVFVAPIAAGEKVVASSESDIFKFIQLNYGDAVAVEMEGRGLLQATHANSQVSALVIRGISDLIDGKSAADLSGFQEIAACNASAFAFEVLAKLKVNKINSQNSDNTPSTRSASSSFIISNSDEKFELSPIDPTIEVSPIIKRFGTWAVTTYGVECLSDKYDFSMDRVDEPDWVNHMRETKNWVNMRDFEAALSYARELKKTQQITDAQLEEKRLLITYDLFKLESDIEKGFITKEYARAFLSTYGPVKFKPSRASSLGYPLEVYFKGEVVILNISNITVNKGASIIVCNDADWFRTQILEIQLNNKTIDSVSEGQIAVRLSRSVLKTSELWVEDIK